MRELLIYRNIIKDKVIKKISENENDKKNLYEAASILIKKSIEKGYCGNILKKYIYELMRKDVNIFTKRADINKVTGDITKILLKDIQTVKQFIEKTEEIFEKSGISLYFSEEKVLNKSDYFNIMENKDICKITDDLIKYHKNNGTGNIIDSVAFKWRDKKFKPIENFDTINFDDIVGYEYQKTVVIQNTKAFAEGKSVNNMLLTGARGTGKSSSVKAAANMFSNQGVKIVEITREQIGELGEIMEKISKSGRKFILFIDDISFESFETGYKQIKSIIDGGLEKKPSNIVIYATSNRRHIVKESFSEREGLDEVRMSDAVNEKLSLSDRFGVTVHFMAPTQQEYLEMVYGIAEKSGVKLDKDSIKKEAIKWEISQNGKSGRTARQFVDYLLSL